MAPNADAISRIILLWNSSCFEGDPEQFQRKWAPVSRPELRHSKER